MRKMFFVGVVSLLLLGGGCKERLANLPGSFVLPGANTSLGDPQENALLLSLKKGSHITIQPTVLGFAANSGVREDAIDVQMNVWYPEDRGEIAWRRTEKRETDASQAAREAFQKKTTSTPIGVVSPTEPAPQYETVEKKGVIVIQNVRDSQSNFLPAFWPEGKYEADNNGIIFLSRDVYQSLLATKKATWHSGIFENPVSASVSLSDALVSEIAGLKEKVQQIQGEATLVADDDFSSYTVLVDGKEEAVRVFTAHDAVAEYVILDNPKNPLILKTTLRPRGFVLINLFNNASTVLKAFIGYSVTEVRL